MKDSWEKKQQRPLEDCLTTGQSGSWRLPAIIIDFCISTLPSVQIENREILRACNQANLRHSDR